MFYALANPVERALDYRISPDWEGRSGLGSGAGGNKRFPKNPAPLALWLHRGLATAVEQGALEDALSQLDRRSMDDGERSWEQFEKVVRAAIKTAEAGAS